MFPSDIDLKTEFTMETEAVIIKDESPFYILLPGDWSGRENRLPSVSENSLNLSPLEIDRDNFEDIMKKLDIRLDLNLELEGKSDLSIRFTSLDDFHPDHIFKQSSLFSDLRDLRQRLSKPETFENAAREVRSRFYETKENENLPKIKKENKPTEKTVSPSEDLLERILDQAGDAAFEETSETVENTELNLLVQKVVKPHLIKTDEKEQGKLIAAVDEAISGLMRQVLHHPQFKALESAWRGLFFLVRNIETDSELKLFLLDICKEELLENLKNVDDLTDSRFYQVLKNEENWAVICGNYDFRVNIEDVATIIRLAKLSNTVNAPFISHVRPDILGIDSLAAMPSHKNWRVSEDSSVFKLWNTLRELPEAGFLGFVLPRFMVRLPYSSETEPTENFSFEEFSLNYTHDDYLWANPCFACALLLAQSFRKNGWKMGQSFLQDIEGIPFHMYKDLDETVIKPGVETIFTQEACEIILENGLMPLLSFRDSDKIRLARFQSIAYPPAPIQGKWLY